MKFVCSLWRGSGFWKKVAKYTAQDVDCLAAALGRHGHSLTVINDGGWQFASSITSICMPRDVSELPDYQPKLWMWSPELHAQIGESFAHIDLDCVVLDDPAGAFDKIAPLQFWDWARDEPYNTSLVFITPGHGHEVWNARNQIDRARRTWRYWTGDQSLVGWALGPGHHTFGNDQGIVQFRRRDMLDNQPRARVIFFCGTKGPGDWASQSQWISEARQIDEQF